MTDLNELKKQIDKEIRQELAETLIDPRVEAEQESGLLKDNKKKHVDLSKYSENERSFVAKMTSKDRLISQLKEDNTHFEKQWQKWQKKAFDYLTRLQKYEPDAK